MVLSALVGKARYGLTHLLFSIVLYGVFCCTTLAESYAVSILLPDVRAPYAKVFEDMAAGVDDSFKGKASRILIAEDETSDSLQKKITAQKPDLLISLGTSSLKKAKSLNLPIPIVAGAVVKNGQGISGISMIPDGALVMDILLELSPRVKQVYTVTNTHSPQELLAQAEAYLAKRDMKLIRLHADSVQEAAIAYREVVNTMSRSDAVWILPGARYLDNSVLSLMLEAAWKKEFVVFSSNPSHVGRGALFSVYPDNRKLGVSLGEQANRVVSSKQATLELEPLRDVFVGVNERTANHLGIEINRELVGASKLMIFSR